MIDRISRRVAIIAVLATSSVALPLLAQPATEKEERPLTTAFFDDETPLTVTFKADLRRLRGDKTKSPWRDASITWTAPDGKEVVIPVRARTRGIWRRRMCDFPPLRLNFARATSEGTPFHGLDRPKLVNYCRGGDDYERLILRELQLYRIYQLLTPVSHKVRLMRMTYVDKDDKPLTTRWAILLEEPVAMAARTNGRMFDAMGATAKDLERRHDVLVGLFQYMIGNTDYSIHQLHNMELVARLADGAYLPVAYDFDFSGAVNAPYATPDPKLSIRRVRDRLFRGHCATPEEFKAGFAEFLEKKDAIYALYSDEIGKLLDERSVRETLEYFDEFFETISDEGRAKRSIIDACRGQV